MAQPPMPELSYEISRSVRNLETHLCEVQNELRTLKMVHRRLKEELAYAWAARKKLESELAELKVKE